MAKNEQIIITQVFSILAFFLEIFMQLHPYFFGENQVLLILALGCRWNLLLLPNTRGHNIDVPL